MDQIRLGRTELMASRSGFGCIPIQRISEAEAVALLHKALDNGINFYDTARGYTDSETKLGMAFHDRRDRVIIATKSHATDAAKFDQDLVISLEKLQTDYIDIYQFHNPKKPEQLTEAGGAYEAALQAKEQGKIRFIGISHHSLAGALASVASGLFDTIQFPLSSLSSGADLGLIAACQEMDMGVIAMKALSGGLITNVAATFAFLRQYPNVVPIWGIQREAELDEFLRYEKNPPQLDEAMRRAIEKDRVELGGSFCRACGYCMPCPVGIPINTAARIAMLVKRTTTHKFLEEEFYQKMQLIRECTECGQCRAQCPYELDTPALLKRMLADYEQFYAENKKG
jgi:predicted aldo/keto reductase-like oxidoreductase